MGFSIYTSCNDHSKLLLAFFTYKLVCKPVMGKMDSFFSSESNQTSWKKPNTIYIFTGIMSYSGNPLLQSRHQRIYQSTHSTGLSVLLCHMSFQSQKLRKQPCLEAIVKNTRIVVSTSAIILLPCETRYFSKYELREQKIPLRSIFCLLWGKNKLSNFRRTLLSRIGLNYYFIKFYNTVYTVI